MKNLSKSSVRACWSFAVFLLLAMLLPRLAVQGIFPDGLLYSSMARNLAMGKGSIWHPFFSSGYWLPYVSVDGYFENLPGMIWVESSFFRCFGEAWWVEKLFSLLVAIANAGLIFLIWRQVFGNGEFRFLKKYGWLPLIFWCIIPPVIWGNANNLMDNFQLIFCLVAVLALLKICQNGHSKWILASSFLIFLAILAKGPVGFYPAAVPFLFAFIFDKRNLNRAFWQSFTAGFGAVALLAGLIFFVPSAADFFSKYWQQRLSLVLSGERLDAENLGWQRLNIFRLVLVETLPLWLLTLILWFLARKEVHVARPFVQNWGRFFLLLGLLATLPIAASARQNAIYILPAMPIFALAAACFALPIFQIQFLKNRSEISILALRWFGIAGIVGVFIFSKMEFGKLGRDRDLLADLPTIQKLVPRGEKVAACPMTMADFGAHTYLQRFHEIELSEDWAARKFVLVRKGNETNLSAHLDSFKLKKPVFDGEAFLLFEK